MRHVLITSAGRRVSLVRAFGREAAAAGAGSEVYTADSKPSVSAACVDSARSFALPRVDDPSYADALLELCEREGIGLIVPTIDPELLPLSRARERFGRAGVEILVPDPGFVSVCRDKRLTHRYFEECGVPVAAEVDRHAPIFPLFVKPFDGSCSKDTYLIERRERLPRELVDDPRLMFLEAIDRTVYDEYTVDLYYDRSGRLRCAVPRLRIETRGGEVSKGRTCRNGVIPFLRSRLGHVEGVRGCVTLQLFAHRSEEDFIGIEINPRFGGGYPLSYRAGANFPGWALAEYLGGSTPPPGEWFDDWEDDLLMLRYDDEVLVHGASAPSS